MDTAGGAGVGVCVESGVPGLAMLSCDGCWLPYVGCAGCAGLGALVVGNGMPNFVMKSFNVVSNGIVGLGRLLPFGSVNCQISLASAWVLTAVSQLSHCGGPTRNILCVRICCCCCAISSDGGRYR